MSKKHVTAEVPESTEPAADSALNPATEPAADSKNESPTADSVEPAAVPQSDPVSVGGGGFFFSQTGSMLERIEALEKFIENKVNGG